MLVSIIQHIFINYETHIGYISSHCSARVAFVSTIPELKVFTLNHLAVTLNSDYHLSFKSFKITRRHLQCKKYCFHTGIWSRLFLNWWSSAWHE